MQIVIDIPKVQYEYLLKIIDAGEEPVGYYERVIMRGTPLPKGHGDLIDRQELLKRTVCKTFGLRSVDIENAPTIIETDKEIEE